MCLFGCRGMPCPLGAYFIIAQSRHSAAVGCSDLIAEDEGCQGTEGVRNRFLPYRRGNGSCHPPLPPTPSRRPSDMALPSLALRYEKGSSAPAIVPGEPFL